MSNKYPYVSRVICRYGMKNAYCQIARLIKTKNPRQMSCATTNNLQATDFIANIVIYVSDMNELTTHILEVIYARMLYIKMKHDESDGINNKGIFTESASNNAVGTVSNGLTVLQNQILAIVRTFIGERGIPISQLTEKLRGIPERQIREDLDFLSAEGHVYSTVDDDHFRATEA
ncbi:Replication protein A 32 kDa subunit [Schistosoma japonicum]|nr:Replication protein A 32 kDa subunit [Schistosoma japonicum]